MDNFVIVYLDNIIIYLNSKKEYKEYIEWVLSRLYKENILVVIKKYKFYTKKTDFIRFIIKLGQISMDLKKIKTIINLKLFLGFYNYYKKFITNWLDKTEPFTRIIKKNKN